MDINPLRSSSGCVEETRSLQACETAVLRRARYLEQVLYTWRPPQADPHNLSATGNAAARAHVPLSSSSALPPPPTPKIDVQAGYAELLLPADSRTGWRLARVSLLGVSEELLSIYVSIHHALARYATGAVRGDHHGAREHFTADRRQANARANAVSNDNSSSSRSSSSRHESPSPPHLVSVQHSPQESAVSRTPSPIAREVAEFFPSPAVRRQTVTTVGEGDISTANAFHPPSRCGAGRGKRPRALPRQNAATTVTKSTTGGTTTLTAASGDGAGAIRDLLRAVYAGPGESPLSGQELGPTVCASRLVDVSQSTPMSHLRTLRHRAADYDRFATDEVYAERTYGASSKRPASSAQIQCDRHDENTPREYWDITFSNGTPPPPPSDPKAYMRSSLHAGVGLPSAVAARTARHHLRQREKDALIEMIRSAVPMDSSGQPQFTESTSSSSSTTAATGMAGLHRRSAAAAAAALGDGESTQSAIWRLLVFDDVGRDIIAPLLKVGNLRELGVTLYMHIRTQRDPIPGAPAIYLCAPTEENIRLVAKDSGARLYEWVYINFTAQVPRPQLESLAQQLVATQLPSIRHIRVCDRALSYVALENDLFSLMLPHSFLTLNRRSTQDAEMEAHLDTMVGGVMHVLLTLQALPVIAHSRTGPAEEVARRLSARLADALRDRQLVPAPAAQFGRPLLLLVDRASDLATALHHPFTYRGLLVDEAGMRLNKCNVVAAEDGHDEVFEVDPERDAFYAENAGLDFGAVGSKIDAALKQYKEEYAALAADTGGADGDGMDGDGGASAVSRMLASAPLLAERKRYLDAHTKLAYNFLNVIRGKHLDSFHGVELGVLQRAGLDKDEFAKLLTTRAGSVADRQRLYLIAYLMCTGPGDEESFVQRMLTSIENETDAIPAAAPVPVAASGSGDGADKAPAATTATAPGSTNHFPALTYLKQLRGWAAGARGGGGNGALKASPAGTSSDGVFGWGGFAQQIAKNFASTLGGSAETELPLTKLVDALLQDASVTGGGGFGGGSASGGSVASPTSSGAAAGVRAKLLESVAGYDPHTRKPVNLGETHFSQVVIFAIGGGSIAEYDDLKRWEAARPHKAVTYGCTAITSGEEMLRELSVLGSES